MAEAVLRIAVRRSSRTPGLPDSTRLTVATETPHCSAKSSILTRRDAISLPSPAAPSFINLQIFYVLCKRFSLRYRISKGGDNMPAGHNVGPVLERLVEGLAALRNNGRFHEPNLDGTAGDYISFQSWEWPQGVGLYGLARLWLHTGNERLRNMLEDWYEPYREHGLPPLNINTTAPMLGLTLLWNRTRDPRWQPMLDDWADRLMAEAPRTGEN